MMTFYDDEIILSEEMAVRLSKNLLDGDSQSSRARDACFADIDRRIHVEENADGYSVEVSDLDLSFLAQRTASLVDEMIMAVKLNYKEDITINKPEKEMSVALDTDGYSAKQYISYKAAKYEEIQMIYDTYAA